MKIVDMINKLNGETQFSPCTEGFYKTIKHVYDKLIEPHLPNKDIVLNWHKLLLEYSNDKDAVFFLRKYSACKINGAWATRRGMLTSYKNGSYVGIDNFFSQILFALAHIGYVPQYSDFKSSMIYRKLPVRFRRETQIERLKSAYPCTPYDNVGINDNNWKLSHTISANQNYQKPFDGILNRNFPNSDNYAWEMDSNSHYYVRRLNEHLADDEIETLRIHLLRVCSPINHFLTPKRRFHHYLNGNDIGEEYDLIMYIKKKFKSLYGDVYTEYLKRVGDDIQDDRSIEEIGEKVVNLYVGNNTGNQADRISNINITEKPDKKVRTNKKASEISKDQLYHMIVLYIGPGYSFRELERRVLGIDSPVRGGGYLAKTALNEAGITVNHKGAIRNIEDLKNAIDAHNDDFGETLNELLAWINTSSYSKSHGIITAFNDDV
jgi:hypothetical protein